MNELQNIFMMLLLAHLFLDYAGQGDFMSKAKNASNPIPGVPWSTVLTSHAAMHGAAVALITQIWWLFPAEAFIHYLTDHLKCRNKISFNTDQMIHIICKLAWVSVVAITK